MSWTTIPWLIVVAVLAVPAARADIFILKDGRKLEGTAAKDGETLVITTYEGKTVRVPEAEVMGHRPEPNRNAFYQAWKDLKADDAAGYYNLALRAKGQGLGDESTRAFERVLKIDPFHEGAGEALGYRQDEAGRWGPAKPERPARTPRAGSTEEERAEARKAAAALKNLDLDQGAGGSSGANEDYRKLLTLAAEKPQVFARVMAAPGHKNGIEERDGEIRAKAATLLGRAGHRDAMQPLLDACFGDPDDRVRWAAAKALPLLEEPIALRKLVDVAVSPKFAWPTRKLACIAIRRYGDLEGIELLMGKVSFELASGHPLDARNKLRGNPSGLATENPLGGPPNPPLMGRRDETILYPALSALKEVTGVAFTSGELDYKTWRDWWKKAHADFKFKD